MKPLIAISTCTAWENNGYNNVVRQTWIQTVKGRIDYRFFIGNDATPERWSDDLVSVEIPSDGYAHLSFKTRASHRWALEHGYDYVLQCFPDTYVVIDRLLQSIERIAELKQNYVGGFRGSCDLAVPKLGDYPCGGAGYWLSKEASEIIVAADIAEGKMSWAEDLWVGDCMGRYRIQGTQDLRYSHSFERGGITRSNDTITQHLSNGTGNFDPNDLRRIYRDMK